MTSIALYRAIGNTIEYDPSFLDESEQSWADASVAKGSDDNTTNWTWCNGRSGGLLSRLAISEAIGIPFTDNNFVRSALHASQADILTETSPGLCCGTPVLCIR